MRSTATRLLPFATALLCACPSSDDGPSQTSETSSTGTHHTDSGSASTRGDSGQDTTSGSSATTGASATMGDTSGGATTVVDTATSGATGTSDTTGGSEYCSVELPPPPRCQPPGGTSGTGGTGATGDTGTGGGTGGVDACDIYTQDCPDGQKCMPYADTGNSWNAVRCSDIAANPAQVGEPCMVTTSAVSGIDNCDIGLMCWGVDNQGAGTCIELCGCHADSPICTTQNTNCVVNNGGVLPLCTPACNPLDPAACPEGEGCYFVSGTFACVQDASGADGAPGQACSSANSCDPGALCASADLVPGCTSPRCCTSICDPADGTECLDGQGCAAVFGSGQAPDECLAGAGVCLLAM